MGAPPPGCPEDEAHYAVCDAVPQGDGVCGDSVQRQILRVALVVAAEEGEDQEGQEEVDC